VILHKTFGSPTNGAVRKERPHEPAEWELQAFLGDAFNVADAGFYLCETNKWIAILRDVVLLIWWALIIWLLITGRKKIESDRFRVAQSSLHSLFALARGCTIAPNYRGGAALPRRKSQILG
jgi:hypothetical protein